jgi:hypothetical protein
MIYRELPLKMVWSQDRRFPFYIPVPFITPDSLDLVPLHDPRNSMYPARLALFAKIKEYPWTAVNSAASCMQRPDSAKKTFIFYRSLRLRLL